MQQSPSPIADRVAEMRAGRPSSSKFTDEQNALAKTHPHSSLVVGSHFPDGELMDAEGHPTSLRAVLAGAAGVVIFYRGAWCPYCNIALRTYRERLAAPLRERGVRLVAISPQAADGSMTMREKHELEFPVLSDPGNQIAGALGILTRPSDEARAMQLEHGLDVSQLNADGTTTVPMPTVAIIDNAGTLAWIDIHADYSTRTEPDLILEAVSQLLGDAE